MSSIQLVILFQLYYNTNLKIKSFTSSNIQKNPKPEKKKKSGYSSYTIYNKMKSSQQIMNTSKYPEWQTGLPWWLRR